MSATATFLVRAVAVGKQLYTTSEKRSFSKPEMVTNICVPDVYVTQT
jgi:hypothetical protein